MRLQRFPFLILFLFLISGTAQAQNTIQIKLEKHKRIDKPAREEVSGIVKDSRYEDVFWVHGDSGTKNRIYAINSDGEMVAGEDHPGLEIKGIENKDWEDITLDGKGNVIVADVGNNCSCRSDQSILFIHEPTPASLSADSIAEYKIHLEKPSGFLYRFLNYSVDAEAVFWMDDALYLITKKFNGNGTKLFRLENPSVDNRNELKLIATTDFDDEVTAADFAHNKLAVLTYRSLWVFEQSDTDDVFGGKVTRYVFEADQVESVAFINENLVLIAEENGDLYKIKLED